MNEDINYDAKEMIDAFDMAEFLTINDDLEKSNGAFLIITDNQCILSYTKDYGMGYHYESIGNALCEITGEEKDMETIPILYSESLEKYIIARIINEPGIEYFILEIGNLKSITPNQLELWKRFMEEYNDIIQLFSEKLEKPFVLVEINGEEKQYYDLEPVEEYLETLVDENKKIPEDCKIIGTILTERRIKNG